MATEIDKEQFEIDDQGRARFSIRYLMDTRAEAIREVPTSFEDLPLKGVKGTPWIGKDGKYIVDAVYEGVVPEFGFDPQFDQYEIITEQREVPIEKFPDYEYLEEEYGAYEGEDGKIRFPQELPAPPTRLGQPLTISSDNSRNVIYLNPMWGTTTYAVPYSVAIWRLVRPSVPSSLQKQAMTVIDKLPPGFDWRGPKKQWYVRPLQRRKNGNSWEIEWQAEETVEIQDPEFLRKVAEVNAK